MRVLPGVILSIGLYPGEVPPQQGNGYEVYTMAKAGNSVLSRSTQSYTQQLTFTNLFRLLPSRWCRRVSP